MVTVNPREEAAYLRHLATEVESDPHIGARARLVTASVLRGRAARLERGGTPPVKVASCES